MEYQTITKISILIDFLTYNMSISHIYKFHIYIWLYDSSNSNYRRNLSKWEIYNNVLKTNTIFRILLSCFLCFFSLFRCIKYIWIHLKNYYLKHKCFKMKITWTLPILFKKIIKVHTRIKNKIIMVTIKCNLYSLLKLLCDVYN